MKRALVFLALAAIVVEARADVARSVSEDQWNLAIAGDRDPVATAFDVARKATPASRQSASPELRFERMTDSLAGRHVFLREHVAGYPVLNAGFSVTIGPDGAVTSFHDRRSSATDSTLATTARQARDIVLDSQRPDSADQPVLVAWLDDEGVARLVWKVIWRHGYDDWFSLVDGSSGAIIRTEPLFFSFDGRIFDPNPVTVLNQPALRDNDDSADAVPESAYSLVTVDGLSSDDQLIGAHVTITDTELPSTTSAKPSAGLVFDRSQDEFEELMAYVHIDRSQRYMQSLGFTGEKTIVPYSIPVDAHGLGGEDNSAYRSASLGQGSLTFGDGGVDDAEDADIILHEYGHAIQFSIAPEAFTGIAASEARALGEGFGDYWAFSAAYAANISSGADPFCIGNWDALCGEGPSSNCGYPPDARCLRRVDGEKTMADYIHTGGQGTEHVNGEIWSSALREIFVDAVSASGLDDGRRAADRTILESHFGMPPRPSFRTAAIRLLDADRRLNDRRLEPSICTAMTRRGILDDQDCDIGLRGDVTMFQSPSGPKPIPDDEPSGTMSTLSVSDDRAIDAIFVAVDVRHPRSGELRVTLKGPDGTMVVLQTQNGSEEADITATYGLDTPTSQPLSPFLGKPAAGTWTLIVTDSSALLEGELRGWSLLLRLAGDDPLRERGVSPAGRLHVAVTGTTAGASGTRFVSDLRILNRGPASATATMIYTPSGQNGLETFDAMTVAIAPDQIVALDDVAGSVFRTSGTGSIELRGDTDALVVTSRIYNLQPDGTFGQFLLGAPTADGIRFGDSPLHVLQIRNTAAFRSNLGIAEIDGSAGEVEVRLFDRGGSVLSSETHSVLPFGHLQFPVLGGLGGAVEVAARAEVRVVSGDARIVAYGSSVDNLSGDAVLVPGARLPHDAGRMIVPAAIHAPGAEGTNWRSDLWLFNGSAESVMIGLVFHPSAGGMASTTTLSLDPHELRLLEDVVSGTFEADGTGSIEVNGTGLSTMIVTSRIWNDAQSGSFGQFVSGIPEGNSIDAGGRRDLLHVDIDSSFRTNVGLTEISGAAATARIRLLDAAGSETFSMNVSLASNENRQVSLEQAGAPTTHNGRIAVEVVSGAGRVAAYASVVDNRTGDAIYVPAR